MLITPTTLVEQLGEARVLVIDTDDPEAYGAFAGALVALLGDVIEVGWYNVRQWAGITLVVEVNGRTVEHPLVEDRLDVRAAAEPFAHAARGTNARLVLVRTGDGDAIVRFDHPSAISSAMDLPVRCPTCKATFDARRLWAEDAAKCAYCGAELLVPDVLAAFVDEHPPATGPVGDGGQLDAFPERTGGGSSLADAAAREVTPRSEGADRDDITDEASLERTLTDALDLLGPSEDDRPTRVGDLLTEDVRRMLRELSIPVPSDDAPPEAIERALAEARRALVRFDTRPSVDSLVAAVGDIDPQALIDEEPTDPSLYLDELPPHKG